MSNTKQVNGSLTKKPVFKEWDYDKDYYWISVSCDNCKHNSQLAVLKGRRFYNNVFSILRCPKCKIQGTLFRTKWNGKQYVKI